MKKEYKLDFSKAKPNRFAGQTLENPVVMLDPDVAKVFGDSQAVNNALRAIIAVVPQKGVAASVPKVARKRPAGNASA